MHKVEVILVENPTQDQLLQDFIGENRGPVILRGFDIGECREKWTIPYLQEICPEKKVKVHRSQFEKLDFRNKNFVYDTISFSDLVKECSANLESESEEISKDPKSKEFLYLRSLGVDPRGKDVSDLSVHFPELYKDLKIPQLFPPDAFFSSVFRITSPKLQLWTHYDTCDNILIQIRGRKRILFYPPWEALNLYLDGDKSLVVDVDNPDLTVHPKFENVEKWEGILEEGDIVFIPALWFHNVTALDFSISVNVFWKNLKGELYDKKDTYGNRDPIPAQLAFRTLDKAAAQLKNLPEEVEDFYLRRMIISLEKRLHKQN